MILPVRNRTAEDQKYMFAMLVQSQRETTDEVKALKNEDPPRPVQHRKLSKQHTDLHIKKGNEVLKLKKEPNGNLDVVKE